jgi:hypothetical protein
LTIKNCDETITDAVCDGTVYVDPITNVEHLISSLVPSTLTWTETVLTANKEKTTYTYVITPIVAPAALTAEVLATIPGATPVLIPGLMPNVAGTAEAIKAYYESIDTESISDVVTVSWETAAVACGATSHTMTLVVEDDCDNIVKAEITLEVAAVEPVEETVTACDSYEWNGETYTVSGDYEYTTTNANGCDSVVILHLTINKSEVVEETVTACDSYEWNGQTYTESGNYVYTTVAANGCDSVEVLHLTILPDATTKSEELALCPSELPYEWYGQKLTEAGSYTATVQYAGMDCDSIIHELKVNVYVQTLPDTVSLPIVRPGEAIDVTIPTAEIQAHVDAEIWYAPNALVTWYILDNSNWARLTAEPVKAGTKQVVLKYAVETDCGNVESAEKVIIADETIDVENISNQLPITNCQKVLRNGQLLILRDGVEYNLMGTEIQ